jgi:hypothetical protein
MNVYPYGHPQSYQGTQYFPQPQGNVYFVNNSLEVANIPMGSALSVVLCPSESTMYVKTLQGGAPTIMVYKIEPYEQSTTTPTAETPDYGAQIAELAKQIEALKTRLGGKNLNDLL